MYRLTKDNLRVALVSVQKDAERVPPMSLVYLATYLRDRTGLKGGNIKILDQNYCADLEAELAAFQPNLIGFTAMAIDYGKVIRFVRSIREKFAVPFILGGVHISTLPESLDPLFDAAVMNEGEGTLHELIEIFLEKQSLAPGHLVGVKGAVYFPTPGQPPHINPVRPPMPNLDDLPVPDFHFANRNYFRKEEIASIADVGIRAYVLSSRGCPYRCTFCSTARFWGKMRFHSPDFTARIVKHFMDEFGSDYLKVEDDLFTVSAKRLYALRDAFIRHGIFDRIKAIECSPRANLVTEELCEAMKAIKIKTLNFGFESGSDRVLNSLKVGSVSVEQNRKAIRLCRKHGFNVYGSLMYGVPGETIEDMEQTNDFIDFAIANKARYVWSFVATPFPATPFWDIALKRGKVSNQMDWEKVDLHNLAEPLLLDDTVDRAEFTRVFLKGRRKLRRLKAKMIFSFVAQNPVYSLRKALQEPKYYLPMLSKWFFRQ
ncbi:MAG: B12-binding domain-containing radical SAM protein [Verrucomicrobia bacterium]|jgi:magnesium-protoporphyrin IX monomethyl ester (oxidative) cyclase|nr:B12-binding domain-containing radical SAM protein [Verrucomicrobiota bacterium]